MGTKIYSANVGDSWAILCREVNNQAKAEALSRDHKPEDPSELTRINAKGGRVESYKDFNGDPLGPPRVWLKNQDIPGLAMSRSFGDLIASQVGVICVPGIHNFSST